MTQTIDPETGWLVRERTESETHTVKKYGANTPGGSREPALYTYTEGVSRRITWSGNGRNRFHPCTHTCVREGFEGGESIANFWRDGERQNPWGRGTAISKLPVSLACAYRSTLTTINGSGQDPEEPHLSQLDWGGARSAIFQDIEGKLPVDISVPLNVVEFGQLKRLVPNVAKSVTNLINWAKHGPYRKVKIRVSRFDHDAPWRKYNYTRSGYYANRVSLESLRWGLKDLSSSYLATTFGVKPLINDVTNWMTKYYQVKLKADWYKLISDGRPHYMRASTPEVSVANDAEQTFEVYHTQSNAYEPWGSLMPEISGRRIWSKTQRGILGALVSVEPKSPMAQTSAVLSSVLGVNAPLSTVWDAIPFSFVADWFYPFGEAIKRVDERVFGGVASRTAHYRIHRLWHSVYTKEFRGIQLDSASIPLTYLRTMGLWAEATFSAYRAGTFATTYKRDEGWPDISILPPSKKGWSVFASITSGALLLQRILRP